MKNIYFIVALFLIMLQTSVNANIEHNINVDFNHPEKFTDFKTYEVRTTKDQERLMRQLNKLIVESVIKQIPAENKFSMTITDIDMAGIFLLMNDTRMYRIVRDTDRVKFKFSYKYSDAQGNLIKEGEVTLKSINTELPVLKKSQYRHSSFKNEMFIFDKWLRKL
ncbi:MAG: DUF3016 domain-containing protein [Proteobacteria bacterium]|nr:DUF3016 domain-containing protein [Pseudomonadota bacterium]